MKRLKKTLLWKMRQELGSGRWSLGDKQALKLWKLFSKISLMEVKRIYKLMGVKFDAYTGESFYNRMLDPTLKMLESKGACL